MTEEERFNDDGSVLQLPSDVTLRPCPFCGSAEISLHNEWTPSYWLECGKCGGKYHDVDDSWWEAWSKGESVVALHHASRDRVIAGWNRRVSAHSVRVGFETVSVRIAGLEEE